VEQPSFLPLVRGDNWNDDTTADPDNLIGGVSFAQGACITDPIYLTVTGTGDAGVDVNTGSADFAAIPPATYHRGWPNIFGGPDNLDFTSELGDVSIDAGNPRKADFGAGPGVISMITPQTIGRYYFEYTLSYDIFSGHAGCGPMLQGCQLGFADGGEKSAGDPIGGSMAQGGILGTYKPYLSTFGSISKTHNMTAPSGTIMGMAVALIPQAIFVPSSFVSVKLPGLMCCPDHKRRLTRKMQAGEA